MLCLSIVSIVDPQSVNAFAMSDPFASVGTTKEHLGFALALRVPIFVVVSKVDQCRPQQVERCVRQVERLLKSPGCKKIPFRVENEDDAVTAASSFHSERYMGRQLTLWALCMFCRYAMFYAVYKLNCIPLLSLFTRL